MVAGGGSGGAGSRPIAAAGGSICYSHGRDSPVAWPAQPPQSGDQPQVRPRCSPCAVATAAAALTWSCGLPAGFLTSPSAGNRVRLPVEQQAQKRKASAKAIAKKPPSFNSPPTPNGCKSRTSPDFIAVTPPPHRAADSQVYAFFSDYFNDLPFFFWAQVDGFARRSLGKNWRAEKRGWGEWESGHQGARGWPGIGA